jgi:hypothetical protein
VNKKFWYKEATPAGLNARLLSADYFNTNWKRIPSVVKTLNQVLQWNHTDKSLSEIPYTFWRNRFGDSCYTQVISTLEGLSLLSVNHSYLPKDISWDKQGHCKTYKLTAECVSLLADTNREYLHLLLTDKKARRRNQKRISDRGYNKLKYGDVCDTLKESIDGIEIDLSKVDKVASKMPDEKRAFVYSLLIDIVEKDYGDLRFNEKDGRIWNPYTQLPSEIKALIKIKGLTYQQTIDIRSCYPSLWAEYVVSLYPPTLSPHIVYGKADNENIERQKYNNLFLNPLVEPKSYLSSLLGIKREKIKDVFIKYFNGHKVSYNKSNPYYKFERYLKTEFPLLYARWKNTDISQTGNNIGKYFETRLMLDQSIYDKAKSLGIVLGYEYDGFSLYAKDDSNCQKLLDFIEKRSVELLGIKLVFVHKETALDIATLAKENNIRIFNSLRDKWVKFCRKTFTMKNRGGSVDWGAFHIKQEHYKKAIQSLIPNPA